jgi:hypothetical protein
MDLMRSIFQSTYIPQRLELLQVFSDYLEVQQDLNVKLNSKLEIEGRPIDMDVLVGNSDSFSNDGIPTALMQAFLDDVIKDMLSMDPSLSLTAFRIITLIVENGLVHPVKCVPAISAMESNPDDVISQQALGIHRKLNEKHASFIHTKNIESIKCIYDYQVVIANSRKMPLRGFLNENAFINPLYSLVRLNRNKRNQFLKTLVNIFDVSKDSSGEMNINYYLFIADNIGYLDYKTQEEVIHVIYCINLILSVSGENLQTYLDGFADDEILEEGMYPRFH